MEKDLQFYLNKYNETNKILKAYFFAFYLASWDAETGAPMGTIQSRNDVIGTLSELEYKLSTSEEYNEAIDYLYEHRNELSPLLNHEIIGKKEDIENSKKVPLEEVIEMSKLLNDDTPVYVKAKRESNYELFKPYLEKLIALTKKRIAYIQKDNMFNNYKGYDVLLNGYEKDMTVKEYDEFFNCLKENLVPFIKKVVKKKLKYNKNLVNKLYPVEGQEKYCNYLQDVMEFDHNYTIMKISEHPFTSGNGNKDVRITTNYHEDLLKSSIFSVIHEMGHGLYELHIDDEVNETMSAGGASMAMHESQSRFMENMIGRSEAFCETHFAKLQEIFPKQLAKVTWQDYFNYVNEVKRDFVRTEADELTYPLHIMVRYELEKKIFNGKITVDELPQAWNKLYKKYLGINVPNDKMGILQDIHWANGSFGYFPTYALGSAYAAQFYNAMAKDVDIDKAIRSGKNTELNNWLKKNVHCYGSSMDPKDILEKATGEKFNPMYYVNYLIEKYSKIYNIED